MKAKNSGPVTNCIHGGCDTIGRQCEGCGWDKTEDRWRKTLLRVQGLHKNKKGLWTLKVGGKKNGS